MIIFLFGEDTFRSRQKLNDLKSKFKKDVDQSGHSIEALDASTAALSSINEKISPSSLFAVKRLIILEDIFKNKSKDIFANVAKLAKSKQAEDNIIIFWDSAVKTKPKTHMPLFIDSAGKETPLTKDKKVLFDFLSKEKYCQEFSQLSNTEVSAWTKKTAEERGASMTGQAAAMIASLVGGDLWQVNNEINKLINYKRGSEQTIIPEGVKVQIEIADVESMVHGVLDENIFALTDAVGSRNKAAIMKLFSEQLEAGMNDAYLLNMLMRQFRILLQISAALDQGESSRKIAISLKLHPFVVQKSLSQVKNFTLPGLKNILNKLIEIDYKLKIGQGDAVTAINLLLASF